MGLNMLRKTYTSQSLLWRSNTLNGLARSMRVNLDWFRAVRNANPTAPEDSSPPTSQPQEITLSMAARNCTITLQHMKARNGHADIVWQWREELNAGGVVFHW